MENIQVGEYIRTKQGYIHIVKSVHKDMIWWCDLDWIPEKDILKHSKNIIDLIECGDYVNGSVVIDLDDLGYLDLEDDTIKYDDIKSVVTKELFNSVKYEVER